MQNKNGMLLSFKSISLPCKSKVLKKSGGRLNKLPSESLLEGVCDLCCSVHVDGVCAYVRGEEECFKNTTEMK